MHFPGDLVQVVTHTGKLAQQQSTGEMLKAAFSEHEKSVKAELSASAKRISDAISAHEQG
ncbi:MbeB family mobilization protein, partial [Klebsiella pneumoniae]|uniref:MbeB family mobilization protein n=1 Tax=Klebsiella pneumoniae TaxID=573 RepID=UPI003EE1CE9D